MSSLATVCPDCFYPVTNAEWGEPTECPKCEVKLIGTRYSVRKMRRKERAALRAKALEGEK